MSTDNYRATLERKREFFHRCEFEHTKCKFMTLNTQGEISIEELNYTLKKFLGKLEYEYGKFEYVRALECYEKGINRYHYHLILVYDKPCPKIDLKWLKKHWVLGNVNIKNLIFKKEYGVLNYITTFKKNNIQDNNKQLTKFPKGCKIITCSNGLKEQIIDDSYEALREFLSNILKIADLFGVDYYLKKHFYQGKECIDKAYFTNVTEDFKNYVKDNFNIENFC